MNKNSNNLHVLEEVLKELFESVRIVYSGYVDDPRNTDNAWMETVAYNFHDESDILKSLKLSAGIKYY